MWNYPSIRNSNGSASLTISTECCRSANDSKGQIFLFLFWSIVLIAAIVLGFSYRSSQELKMVSASWERSKVFFISWSALQEVIRILNKDDTTVDSYQDEWHTKWAKGKMKGETKEGTWKVERIYDMERYVDINKAGEEVLKRIYGQLPIFYDSLLDWLDADSTPRPNGAEDDYYKNQDYGCRNGDIRNLFELGMIRGGDQIIKAMLDTDTKIARSKFSPFDMVEYYSRLEQESSLSNPVTRVPPRCSIGVGEWYSGTSPQKGRIQFGFHGFFPWGSSLLSGFLWKQNLAYADGGCGHGSCDGDPWPFDPWNPPWPGGPWPPGSPGPPEDPPQGPPFDPPDPQPRGEGVTVYGDGRCNINTSLPQVLSALGLQKDTVRRIIWFTRVSNNIFPAADTNTIVTELIKAGWLKPREVLFNTIVSNINTVVNKGKLKVNSSYFLVKITSDTFKGAVHKAIAVVKRTKDAQGQTSCKVVAWWEWIF